MTLELDDAEKPQTVSNFLSYLNSGRYENLFAHRLEPGFVLQTGGYALRENTVTRVEAFAPVANEFTNDPRFSNLYGTIAMAKIGGDPDSATSEWFINLGDNSANLDNQNGGFTVFGRVIAGFEVLESFNTTFNQQGSGGRGVYNATEALGSAFDTMPLLTNQLRPEDLIFTELAVIPEPGTLGFLAVAAGGGVLCGAVRRFRLRAHRDRRN